MRWIADRIVKLRILILILSVLLIIPSVLGFFSTRINYDILYYLPDEIETMKGQNILLDEFGKGAYGMFVCNGMESRDVVKLKEKVENIDHVAEVICLDSLTEGLMPVDMLPREVTDIFYGKDGQGTLMFMFFDTSTSQDETMDAIEELRALAGEQCFLSSMSAIATDTKLLVENETIIYSIVAVILSMIVLLVTTESFLIPPLFLLSIGFAIIYNMGTNVIQGEISFLTLALVAILQMGVTMDYSIFLYHSYMEERQKQESPEAAMARAIEETFVSVTGSSLTTVAGFLAMCFMTFTLGMDMGIVMAKGVVLGVICCITILPAMILVCDKWIQKTTHKAFRFKTEGFSKLICGSYPIVAILMVLLWIPAIWGSQNVNVYYKLDESLPKYLPSILANEEVEKNYDMNSVSMILVHKDLSSKDTKALLSEIKNVEGIAFALGSDSLMGPMLPSSIVPEELSEKFSSDTWKMLLLSSEYAVASDEVNAQCEQLQQIIKSYDPEGMLVGEAPATKDLVRITTRDFKVVSLISIGAIFILIFLVLKSISLPFILVLVIELAINLNMGISYFTGATLPFIASVCIGTIQLGATVDYAILMTNRYIKERKDGAGKKEAVQTALSTSLNAVFTSAMGFFASTVGVALYSDADLIASLCLLLARGAIISMVIVLTILPAMLLVCDKLILRTTWDLRAVK